MYETYKYQYEITGINKLYAYDDCAPMIVDFKEVYYSYFKWCKQNCFNDYHYNMIKTGDYGDSHYIGYRFYFKDISDFIAFKLFAS